MKNVCLHAFFWFNNTSSIFSSGFPLTKGNFNLAKTDFKCYLEGAYNKFLLLCKLKDMVILLMRYHLIKERVNATHNDLILFKNGLR